MPIGECDTCRQYNEQLKFRGEGWHCQKCIVNVPMGKQRLVTHGCTKYGSPGKLYKRIVERGKAEMAKGK